MSMKIPTTEFYEILQNIYYIFNKELFDDTLPNCLITVQRKKRVMGYFSPNRWVDNQGNKVHELALNPSYFTSCNFIEVFQTIVHEMCHLWQFEFGTPSRRTYHNKEWAVKMESLGLIPSSTGRPGGNKTGQSMNDYPEKGGVFESLCIKLFKDGLFVNWFDRFPEERFISNYESESYETIETFENDILESLYTTVAAVINDIVPVEEVKAMSQVKQKTKYKCPSCNAAVWGKPNLNIKCNTCEINFELVSF
jgi:hypothetical protein